NEKTTFTEAFSMADDVLHQGVKGVTDLMVRPGLINLDFADVRAVMDEMGKAMMGTGEDNGEERAVQAAEKAIANPLLDEISLRGARGVLINITGGYDLTLFELDEAANRIREEVDAEANIIVGSTLDPNMDGVMRVSVVATGIDASEESRDIPLPRRSMAEPLRIDTAPAGADAAASVEVSEPAQEVVAETAADSVSDYDEADEPNLFDGFDPQSSGDDGATEAYESADDVVPEPAYKPAEEPVQYEATETDAAFSESETNAYGAPSHDALARLQAAVHNTQNRLTGQATSAPEAASEDDEGEKPRFRINSLINRMTGHQAGAGADASRPVRQQPPVQSAPAAPQPSVQTAQDAAKEEEEQIEIPAFLRRQAN
ncbi:MAG: cell division protein FtsZ, partial [Pseudomonadota bacterium]